MAQLKRTTQDYRPDTPTSNMATELVILAFQCLVLFGLVAGPVGALAISLGWWK